MDQNLNIGKIVYQQGLVHSYAYVISCKNDFMWTATKASPCWYIK
jgi:hypothetical protein